ncbi:malate dehydrogenase [Halorarius litoreus]|uniref:malate dehydrogenase n=1 Tax=Halorarius litoreus TaxID=2962676 RepID=UPI0020CC988D|nr:lactate dehydrogenase [Halorarius litoreus]
MDVAVLGAGTIGSTVAYVLATECRDVDVRLVDVETGRSRGHAIDIAHATAHVAHSVGGVVGSRATSIEAVDPGPAAVAGVDCLVVTASAPRPDSASHRGGRLAWLESNRDIVSTIADWLRETDPCPVLCVTNPLDVLTYQLYRESGWPRHRFVGYSLSETARIADELARRYDVDHEAVYCPVIGEHGEQMVPVFSRATIDGERLGLSPEERDQVVDYMLDVPYDVIELRGEADSSRWVTGRGVALAAWAILQGGVDEPVGLSTPLDGEYGYTDVSLSVPVRLDAEGVTEIVEWELSGWERQRLNDARDAVAVHCAE